MQVREKGRKLKGAGWCAARERMRCQGAKQVAGASKLLRVSKC